MQCIVIHKGGKSDTARNTYVAALIESVKDKGEAVAAEKPKKPRAPRKPKAAAEA